MSRLEGNTKLTIGLISALFMLGLTGCSASTPAPDSAALKHTELTFNINQCQQLSPGLFKCPAIDKPICNPDYTGTPVECIRIGKSGSLFVQQLEN